MEDVLDIEVVKVGSSYVVNIPQFGSTAPRSVSFSTLQDACDLANACVDWFSGSTFTPPANGTGGGS